MYDWDAWEDKIAEAFGMYIAHMLNEKKLAESGEKGDEVKEQSTTYYTEVSHEAQWWPEFIRWLVYTERIDMQGLLGVLDSCNIRMNIIVMPQHMTGGGEHGPTKH